MPGSVRPKAKAKAKETQRARAKERAKAKVWYTAKGATGQPKEMPNVRTKVEEFPGKEAAGNAEDRISLRIAHSRSGGREKAAEGTRASGACADYARNHREKVSRSQWMMSLRKS